MKNVNFNDVEEIRGMVNDCKKYIALHENVEQMFENRSWACYGDIQTDIEDHISDVLSDISDYFGDLYQDWSGIREFSHSTTDKDLIDEYEEDLYDEWEMGNGLCTRIEVKDQSASLGFLPVDFITEFISEYGIFTINDNKVVGLA